MARRFRRTAGFPPVRAPRRKVQWFGQDTVDQTIFGEVQRTAAGVSIFPLSLLAVDPITIVRIVGDVMIAITAANAALDAVVAHAGVIVVKEEAFAAGAASLPDPRSDTGKDWMWLRKRQLIAGSTGPSNAEGLQTYREIVDIRSMRKLEPGDVLCALFGLDQVVGVSRTVQAAFEIRMAAKLV